MTLAYHSPPSSAHSSSTARTRSFLSLLCAATLPNSITRTRPMFCQSWKQTQRLSTLVCVSKSMNCWPSHGKPPLLNEKTVIYQHPSSSWMPLTKTTVGPNFWKRLLRVIHAGQLAGIKFLVTSRPDPKIVNICKSFPPSAVCKLHEIDTANVQNDIEKYLREALPELKDEPELALLSQRAGGLFIYATTAVRFISPPTVLLLFPRCVPICKQC
jgi:hypothetical protein